MKQLIFPNSFQLLIKFLEGFEKPTDIYSNDSYIDNKSCVSVVWTPRASRMLYSQGSKMNF